MCDAIIVLYEDVRSFGDRSVNIRVDPAPGLTALENDPIFRKGEIHLDSSRPKNINKYLVVENAIKELGLEFLHLCPEGGPVPKVTLVLATATINTRIRYCGLSDREVWTQQDQITGAQLPIDDKLIMKQLFKREHSNGFRAKSKAHDKGTKPGHNINTCDLVYLTMDRDKTKAREKYMAVSTDNHWYKLRKFTKSQFCSKCYDVRVTNCYPVTPITLAQSPIGPI